MKIHLLTGATFEMGNTGHIHPRTHIHLGAHIHLEIHMHLDRLAFGFWAFSPDAPRPLFNRPFVPHIESWEPRSLAVVQDGPHAYAPNILRLQKEGAQVCMSE